MQEEKDKFTISPQRSLQTKFNYILQDYGTLHITLSSSQKQISPMNANAIVDTYLCEMRGVCFHYNDLAWSLTGVSWKGWHTQLGSGYLSCTLAFPESPQQPCGKTLKRETARRMKTIIMQSPVYYSVPWTEPGLTVDMEESLLGCWCTTAVLYCIVTILVRYMWLSCLCLEFMHTWSAFHIPV